MEVVGCAEITERLFGNRRTEKRKTPGESATQKRLRKVPVDP
jgi:hypothetical protein